MENQKILQENSDSTKFQEGLLDEVASKGSFSTVESLLSEEDPIDEKVKLIIEKTKNLMLYDENGRVNGSDRVKAINILNDIIPTNQTPPPKVWEQAFMKIFSPNGEIKHISYARNGRIFCDLSDGAEIGFGGMLSGDAYLYVYYDEGQDEPDEFVFNIDGVKLYSPDMENNALKEAKDVKILDENGYIKGSELAKVIQIIYKNMHLALSVQDGWNAFERILYKVTSKYPRISYHLAGDFEMRIGDINVHCDENGNFKIDGINEIFRLDGTKVEE